MPSSPKYGSAIQNLKTVADKIGWKVQYQDRVVEGKFQVRVVLTPHPSHQKFCAAALHVELCAPDRDPHEK